MKKGDPIYDAIHSAIHAAVEDGTTFRKFELAVYPLLSDRKQWAEKKKSIARLALMFHACIMTLYSSRNWGQIQKFKDRRPYLMYDAIQDSHTRPQHRAWDGMVLLADDPWWNTHYPPNGWDCRCSVIQMSNEMAEEQTGKSAPDIAPPDKTIFWKNLASGQSVAIPDGIDPGFNRNPGIHSKEMITGIIATTVNDPAYIDMVIARILDRGGRRWGD